MTQLELGNDFDILKNIHDFSLIFTFLQLLFFLELPASFFHKNFVPQYADFPDGGSDHTFFSNSLQGLCKHKNWCNEELVPQFTRQASKDQKLSISIGLLASFDALKSMQMHLEMKS